MYKIYYHEQFKNKFKKINRNSKTLGHEIASTLKIMGSNPFHHKLNTRKLKTSQYDNIYLSKVNRGTMIIWNFNDKNNSISLMLIRES